MIISAIAAMAENHTIGNKGDIPWHIPADFKHFKKTTMGKPIIMGRKTFETLPGGMLPGRPHIVVSRSAQAISDNKDMPLPPNLIYVRSIVEGITSAQDLAKAGGQDEIFIIGGGEIYRQALEEKLIQRLYLTIVHESYDGDAHFPEFDWGDWHITAEDKHEGDPAFTFFTLDRK